MGVLALFAASTVIALLVAELATRLVAPQQLIVERPDLWEPADSVGYLHRSGVTVTVNTGERPVTVRTDADGFRVGASGRKEASTRILLLGDSFVEALQVEYGQSFSHLLEQSVEQRLGQAVAVRNAGISGWDPNQYFLRGRTLLARDHYDLLVVCVFVGNDAIKRAVDYIPARQPDRSFALRLPQSFSGGEIIDALARPVNHALEARSHLFVLAKNHLSVFRMRLGLTEQYFPEEYLRSEASAPRWDIAAERLRALAAVATSYGTPTLFVLIPERFQVYRSDFDDYVRGFGLDSATVDLDQPSRMFQVRLRARGLHVIDALPDFRKRRAETSPLFGRVDAHLSPQGHVVLTEAVADTAAALLRQSLGTSGG